MTTAMRLSLDILASSKAPWRPSFKKTWKNEIKHFLIITGTCSLVRHDFSTAFETGLSAWGLKRDLLRRYIHANPLLLKSVCSFQRQRDVFCTNWGHTRRTVMRRTCCDVTCCRTRQSVKETSKPGSKYVQRKSIINPLDRLERSAWTPGDVLHKGSCDRRHDPLITNSENYVENPRSLTHWVTQIISGSLRKRPSSTSSSRQAGNPWCSGIRKLFCLVLFRYSWFVDILEK